MECCFHGICKKPVDIESKSSHASEDKKQEPSDNKEMDKRLKELFKLLGAEKEEDLTSAEFCQGQWLAYETDETAEVAEPKEDGWKYHCQDEEELKE